MFGEKKLLREGMEGRAVVLKIAVDVPALEAEFQRSQADAEAQKASKIAGSEAELAGAGLRRHRTSRPAATLPPPSSS